MSWNCSWSLVSCVCPDQGACGLRLWWGLRHLKGRSPSRHRTGGDSLKVEFGSCGGDCRPRGASCPGVCTFMPSCVVPSISEVGGLPRACWGAACGPFCIQFLAQAEMRGVAGCSLPWRSGCFPRGVPVAGALGSCRPGSEGVFSWCGHSPLLAPGPLQGSSVSVTKNLFFSVFFKKIYFY